MAKSFNGLIFDKDFVLEDDLRKLGFRKTDIKNEYFRILDFVHADYSDSLDHDITDARFQVSAWKRDVQNLLSKPVGKYKHKRRPHRNLLPMMNSEDLRNSVVVKLIRPRKQLWEYELHVKFTSKHKVGNYDHADLTNQNITRAGRNRRKVAWKGWADEMLDGRGLKGVPSARNLMRRLFR